MIILFIYIDEDVVGASEPGQDDKDKEKKNKNSQRRKKEDNTPDVPGKLNHFVIIISEIQFFKPSI